MSSQFNVLAREKKEKKLLDEITRDIVTIVVTLISFLAFGFAIWAAVVSIRQADRIMDTERQFLRHLEALQTQLLLSEQNILKSISNRM